MAERKNIALFFSYNEGWIGGTYYILSLIQALNLLRDESKPNLIIVCTTEDEYLLAKQTGYPYLTKHEIRQLNLQFSPSLVERIINKISTEIIGRKIVQQKQLLNYPQPVDVVFPCPQMNTFSDVKKSLFWIPDFQEYHLPEFFSNNKDEKEWRYNFGKYVAQHNLPLVVSSKDALNDFNTIYANNKSEVSVIPFAVSHPDYNHLDVEKLKEKYHLTKPYFFSPNQFWKHKNHEVVIEAARLLTDQGNIDFQIAFSGKESDFRNPDYINELKEKVKKYKLENQISFLGFIDRAEQLQLMNHAVSIIQPSLFEGWSTVIEDVKAMNQPIIASNLAVHQEQLQTYGGMFFDKTDYKTLAENLKQALIHPPAKKQYDYNKDRLAFAQNFIASVS